MGKKATLEEWKGLYEMAIKIKEMKPWERLNDLDFITIEFDENSEPIVCSILGKGGETYGICCYRGYEEIYKLFSMIESKDMPPEQVYRYQDCLACYFGDREELNNKEYKLIKDLGYKFRGKGNWIFFRSFDPIFIPDMPNRDEVLEMTKILEQLYYALQGMYFGFNVDYENGMMLVRAFDKKTGSWVNRRGFLEDLEMKFEVSLRHDELFIKRIKNKKPTKVLLELDIAYLNSIFKDEKYEKPLVMRMALLSDRKIGMILSHHLVTPEDKDTDIYFNTLLNYIYHNGKPKTVFVRDKYVYQILKDLCEKINVELKISKKLPAIDFFVNVYNSNF
ncbi:hypothetical protein SAMN02745227_01385 [Anaerobranca californiensis DSM 14826]|uniref:NurA domain-containing protein n=1 Tax=Anaerobranca californiensis DSM 14826 TaxID=1120989 RepID=A0A1M6PB39_9FIRM|nr:hypothetical protein [Anaerobranca californiensis]SHK05156.1 hypothetical protein SAMN02745227_01385 [Anaerobranca californiensis DSM 14826]